MKKLLVVSVLLSGCFDFGAGLSALFAVVVEAPGLNCPAGGLCIQGGIDTNRNGRLDAEEVDSQAFVCDEEPGSLGPVIEGSYSIQNQRDAEALAGVEVITGDISIAGAGLGAVKLPELVEVRGSLSVGGGVTALELPLLETIGQDWLVTSDTLESVSAPKLSFIGRDLSFVPSFSAPDSALVGLDLPLLLSVGRNLRVVGQSSLLGLSLPSLVEVPGAFEILSNRLVPTCQAQEILDQLTTAPAVIDISGNDDATACL